MYVFKGDDNIIITVDRLEGDLAVCLDDKEERVYVVPVSEIGFDVSDGDVLSVTFEKRDDLKKTAEDEIIDLFERLKNRE